MENYLDNINKKVYFPNSNEWYYKGSEYGQQHDPQLMKFVSHLPIVSLAFQSTFLKTMNLIILDLDPIS